MKKILIVVSFVQIYSCIGPIIIAINPYKSIPALYDQHALQLYLTAESSGLQGSLGAPAHVWRIAKEAFINLSMHQMRQAIVIRFVYSAATLFY